MRSELTPLVEQLGRMPTHTELREGGHHRLSKAVSRFGGSRRWATEFGVTTKLNREVWSDAKIASELSRIADGVMPTSSDLREMGLNALSCAIARGHGFHWWATRLGLARKGTETHMAQRWERHEARFFASLGCTVEEQSTRHPFDLLVNGWRVDVKVSRFHDYSNSWVFAGIKKGAHADFFDLLCLEGDVIRARYMVPARAAQVHTISLARHALLGEGPYGPFREAIGPVLSRRAA